MAPEPEVVAEPDPLGLEAEEPEAPSVIGATPAELPVMPEGTFDATPEPIASVEPVEPEATGEVKEVTVSAEQEQVAIDNGAFIPVEATNPPTWVDASPADPAIDSTAVGPGNEPLVP